MSICGYEAISCFFFYLFLNLGGCGGVHFSLPCLYLSYTSQIQFVENDVCYPASIEVGSLLKKCFIYSLFDQVAIYIPLPRSMGVVLSHIIVCPFLVETFPRLLL